MKPRVMKPKEKRKPLMPDDIQVGKTYRGKNPTKSMGVLNDRTVIWKGPNGTLQYDSSAVKLGQKYPTVTTDEFLAWASHQVF